MTEGEIRVVEWKIDYDSGPLKLIPKNVYRYRFDQYLGGQWVEVPVLHLDRDGNLKEGRLSPQ
jgi:hypothetical protein